jgi:putative transposase
MTYKRAKMIAIGYQYRLYPTKVQEARLNDTIEICRQIYNNLIFESHLAYKEGYKIKFDELQRTIPTMVPRGKIYSKVAQVVLWQFYNNLKAISALRKMDKRTGNLRFKSKSRFNSINYNQSGFKMLDRKTLKLSKIGKIKINLHRPIQGKIKEIRIKRNLLNHWYAYVITESKCSTSCSLLRKKIVGIDVGIKNFAYDSEGHVKEHPQILRKSENKLKKTQRKLSRKMKGSANRFKQKLKFAKIHKKIKNQRNDFLHKISRHYVDNYDTIFVEDFRIQNLQKNHRLAKSIFDSAWYSFFQKLEYKAGRAGILFRKISAAGTSQGCSGCGKTVQKTLAIRTHSCPYCGLVIDRDHNAAINIKQKGMDSLPMVCREVTPVETAPLFVIQHDRQGQSLNQEANDLIVGSSQEA